MVILDQRDAMGWIILETREEKKTLGCASLTIPAAIQAIVGLAPRRPMI